MTTNLSLVLSILFLLSGSSLAAEGRSLRDSFANPDPEFRPLVIMHSQPVRDARAIDELAARRAGGAVIDAGVAPGSKDVGGEPWNNPTYLADAGQFERLRQAVRALRERKNRVWIYDELGYPSGSAGGRVLDGHPEFQVEVLGCRCFTAPSGQPVQVVPAQGRVLACFGLRGREGHLTLDDKQDLTERARAGAFAWSPPSGEGTVCLFERFQPDTWRRHNIPRRNVNILDRAAVTRFIELTHQRYARELGPLAGVVDAFFTDEPQFGSAEHWGSGLPEAVPMVQWTASLPDAFRAAKGYALLDVLPALFHAVGPETAKYRFDFYDVQSDLVAENFFGQIESFCRAHGVASSGHMLLEESLLFHVMFSGSMLKNWARMDLPGVDLLGASPYKTMAGWESGMVAVPEDFSCKLAASVAHLTGKRGVFTESFAVARSPTLRQTYGVAAWQFSGGITHMSTYGIQHELSAGDYASFSDFVGRLALLTRRGVHVANVAVLVPEASVWAAYTPPDGGRFKRYLERNPDAVQIDRVFRDSCHALLRAQRDFDCLSEELLTTATIDGGRLCLAKEAFGVLVLPECRMIRPKTLAHVKAFLTAGGHAVFVGRLPSQSPERGEDPAVTRMAQALLGEFPQQAHHLADVADLSKLPAWIGQHLPAEVNWSGPEGVRLLHRREPQREIILVANPASTAADGVLTAPAAGRASVWNPEDGTIRDVGQIGKGTAIRLSVPGESAQFLVVE